MTTYLKYFVAFNKSYRGFDYYCPKSKYVYPLQPNAMVIGFIEIKNNRRESDYHTSKLAIPSNN